MEYKIQIGGKVRGHKYSECGSFAEPCEYCKTPFSVALNYGGDCPGSDVRAFRISAWRKYIEECSLSDNRTEDQIIKLAIANAH